MLFKDFCQWICTLCVVLNNSIIFILFFWPYCQSYYSYSLTNRYRSDSLVRHWRVGARVLPAVQERPRRLRESHLRHRQLERRLGPIRERPEVKWNLSIFRIKSFKICNNRLVKCIIRLWYKDLINIHLLPYYCVLFNLSNQLQVLKLHIQIKKGDEVRDE